MRILKYYAQYEAAPAFYTFDHIDRSRLDVGVIAKHIWDEDMGRRKMAEYLDSLWAQGDDNLLRLFFGRKSYFMDQVDIEVRKLAHPDLYEEKHVTYDTKVLEDLPLYEIGKLDPQREKDLRDGSLCQGPNTAGDLSLRLLRYGSGSRIPFQVEHIFL